MNGEPEPTSSQPGVPTDPAATTPPAQAASPAATTPPAQAPPPAATTPAAEAPPPAASAAPIASGPKSSEPDLSAADLSGTNPNSTNPNSTNPSNVTPGRPGFSDTNSSNANPGGPTLPSFLQEPQTQRSDRPIMIGIVVSVVLILVGCIAVPAFLLFGNGGPGGRAAGFADSRPGPQSSTPPSPITKALDAQSEALLRGDEAGWLAPINPANTDLVNVYRTQFRVLRGLHVTRWYQRIRDPRGTTANGVRGTQLIRYCLADPSCPKGEDPNGEDDPGSQLVNNLEWTVSGDTVQIVGVSRAQVAPGRSPSPAAANPSPLDYVDASPLREDLVVSEGRRAIVAAPRNLTGDLPRAVAAADAAADVVDPLARFYPRPDRYVIFLAGSEQYNSWFHNFGLSSAFTVLGRHNTPVVVDLSGGWATLTASVIQHEMGHVVTMQAAKAHEPLWLVEGIAEYIRHYGKPVGQSDAVPTVKKFIQAGGWDQHVAIDFKRKTSVDSLLQEAANYAMSYLGVRCIATKFGEDKLWAFFDAVVRRNKPDLVAAAPSTLGVEWSTVDMQCVADIRALAG